MWYKANFLWLYAFCIGGVSTSAFLAFYFHVIARQSVKKKEHFVVWTDFAEYTQLETLFDNIRTG